MKRQSNDSTGSIELDVDASGGGGGGDATAANQVIGNASLASIDSKVTSPLTVQATNLDIRDLAFASDKVDVSGSSSVGVTGTFFQATQPISAAALPLPSGASTEATLALIKAKTDNIDVALSTRTKPSDQQHVIVDSGSITTGGLTDTQLRASAVPVSGTVTVDTSLLATAAKQDTGNTSLGSIKTNTDPLVASGAGGYVRQDSTGTIAKESGGNLATIAGKDFATQTTLALIKAKTDNIDVALSTRTKPADNQAVNLAQVVGTATDVNSGNKSAGSQRVVIATDDINLAAINAVSGTTAGAAVITDASGTLQQYLRGLIKLAITAGSFLVTATLAAGTNLIGAVNVKPATAGGLSVAMMTSADGSTALTNTAQAIKASAGQLFGWYIYNPNSTAAYVSIYNVAAGSVTVGTTNPMMSLCIPATSAANLELTNGIEFTNTGWSAAATTTGGGSTAPGTAMEVNFFYK